jgi:hypothetical protein
VDGDSLKRIYFTLETGFLGISAKETGFLSSEELIWSFSRDKGSILDRV